MSIPTSPFAPPKRLAPSWCGVLAVTLLLCTRTLAQTPDAHAATPGRPAPTPAEVLEMLGRPVRSDTDGGVIANQVITVAGQDFYKYFVGAWRDLDGSERYALAVHERPSARKGSEIWIEYAQRPVYRTFLPPARALIRQIGEDAADLSYRAVQQADAQRQLNNDNDLAIDEF